MRLCTLVCSQSPRIPRRRYSRSSAGNLHRQSSAQRHYQVRLPTPLRTKNHVQPPRQMARGIQEERRVPNPDQRSSLHGGVQRSLARQRSTNPLKQTHSKRHPNKETNHNHSRRLRYHHTPRGRNPPERGLRGERQDASRVCRCRPLVLSRPHSKTHIKIHAKSATTSFRCPQRMAGATLNLTN